jgi:DNA processing protein
LITAGWALEQGRECFLVPGPLDAPTSEGCHAFLRSFPGQTRVVCGIPELLEDLGLAEESDPTVGAGAAGGETTRALGLPGRGAAGVSPRTVGRPSSTVAGAGPEAVLSALAPVERSVAEVLTAGPATADELALRSRLSGAAILSALTLLELRGLVVGSYGRYMPAGPLARWPGRRHGRQS